MKCLNFPWTQICLLSNSSFSNSILKHLLMPCCCYCCYYCCCSVAKSYPTLCDSMDCSMPGFPVLHYLLEFAQIHVHWISNHLILSCLLLLPPSIFPSIRVFSSELVLRIRWPKFWSFSFSISPSNEYSGLISFRTDWLDLLAVQGTLKKLL